MKLRAALLVAAQLVGIGYLLLTGPLVTRPAWIWLQILGLYILAWAVAVMRPHRVRIGPGVGRNARLITHGPFRFVRHPMYLGVLLMMLALVIDYPRADRWAIWVMLLLVLLLKAQLEETLLQQRFPEYRRYQQRTKRLLPFVF